MRVDIGMPVLNGSKFLPRALDSILRQTHSNLRIIFRDNNSEDSTLEIAKSFARFDPRLVIYSGERVSASDNFGFVLEKSSSEIFMWASHDDVWSADFVSQGVRELERGADFFSPNWWVGDIGTQRGFASSEHPLKFLSSPDPLARSLGFLNLHHWSHKCNLVYALFDSSRLRSAVGRQSIEDDGALGALISASFEGNTTDEVLFWKQGVDLSPRSRNVGLNLVSQVLKSVLSKTALDSDGFTQAKEKSLRNLHILFPEISQTLDFIFSFYTGVPQSKGGTLVPDFQSLLEMARSEKEGWETQRS